jgi:hypothetical protein
VAVPRGASREANRVDEGATQARLKTGQWKSALIITGAGDGDRPCRAPGDAAGAADRAFRAEVVWLTRGASAAKPEGGIDQR